VIADAYKRPAGLEIGHVGDRDGLPIEYAGWVRIVGTAVHPKGVEPVTS
jgi:hypothetical protein